MENISPEWLQQIDALQEVPLPQLQWFIDHSTLLEIAAGQQFFKPGDPIRGTFIVLEGSFKLCMLQGKVLREVTTYEPQAITGYLPFSRAKITQGAGQAITPVMDGGAPRRKAPSPLEHANDVEPVP